jgi:hypothetical protein
MCEYVVMTIFTIATIINIIIYWFILRAENNQLAVKYDTLHEKCRILCNENTKLKQDLQDHIIKILQYKNTQKNDNTSSGSYENIIHR